MAAPVTKVTRVGGAGAFAGSLTVSEETFNGWSFRSVTAPIASSSRIEEVEAALSLPPGVPVPEALFADNSLTITHKASGTQLRINAVDALRSWHSRQSRVAAEAGGVVCATSFDWAYENEYDGLLVRGPEGTDAAFEHSASGLPMDLLVAHDEIMWSCSLSLYEDDLHDMGVSECTVRARVMESCFFVLLQTFVRLDGDRTMLREARYCHVFGSNTVLRDLQLRAASAQQVIGGGQPSWGPAGAAGQVAARASSDLAGSSSVATARPAAAAATEPGVARGAAAKAPAVEVSTSPFAPKPEQRLARATGARLGYDALRVRGAVKPTTHTVEAAPLA